MSKSTEGRIFVAKETFVTSIDGTEQPVHAGVTRVREGHSLLSGREHMFELLTVHFEVEQAPAAPVEKRAEKRGGQ